VHPRREVFEPFDLLEDDGVFLVFDRSPLPAEWSRQHQMLGFTPQ
jgi:hypothetical protein